jgi:hypothetical protein
MDIKLLNRIKNVNVVAFRDHLSAGGWRDEWQFNTFIWLFSDTNQRNAHGIDIYDQTTFGDVIRQLQPYYVERENPYSTLVDKSGEASAAIHAVEALGNEIIEFDEKYSSPQSLTKSAAKTD